MCRHCSRRRNGVMSFIVDRNVRGSELIRSLNDRLRLDSVLSLTKGDCPTCTSLGTTPAYSNYPFPLKESLFNVPYHAAGIEELLRWGCDMYNSVSLRTWCPFSIKQLWINVEACVSTGSLSDWSQKHRAESVLQWGRYWDLPNLRAVKAYDRNLQTPLGFLEC